MRKVLALLLCACSTGWTTPAPAGVNCHGGGTGSAASTACTAAMTVSANDVFVCIGTMGSNVTPTSITTSGTATCSCTVVSGMNSFDATAAQGIQGGWCNCTVGGTVTPTFNYTATTFRGLYCEDFTGATNATDGAIATSAAGASTTNGVVSGNITTTKNGNLLIGGTCQLDGTTATISAGTLSQAYTKLTCMTDSTNNLCMEWAVQTTAAASTAADWTYNATHRVSSNILAVQPTAGAAAATVCPSEEMLGVGCSL